MWDKPLVISALGALLVGCASPRVDPARCAGTTRLSITGTPGAAVRGYYVQDGQRVPLTGPVPQTIEAERVSRVEVAKVNPADTVVVDLHYESGRATVTTQQTLGPDARRTTLQVGDGFKGVKTSSR
jgi:hypothetical protein